MPATEQELSQVGAPSSSVSGIVALPGLQGRFFDDRFFDNRVILPAVLMNDATVSNTSPKDNPTFDDEDEIEIEPQIGRASCRERV